MSETPEKNKEILLTSMEMFQPEKRDRVETFPVGPEQNIRFRVISISETTLQAIQATRDVLVRDLRTQFMQEAIRGERRLRLLEDIEELKDQFTIIPYKELQMAFKRTWSIASPSVEEEYEEGQEPPKTVPYPTGWEQWSEETLRDEVVKLLLIETLLRQERQVIEAASTQAIRDIGYPVPSNELDMQALTTRIAETVEREINERRLVMRDLTMAQLTKRLSFSAAMEYAVPIAADRILVIVLYAVAREEENRNQPRFDLSSENIKSVTDALRDPTKTYQAMVKVFKGDEVLLITMARSIAGFSGMLSEELREKIREASLEPFRTGTVPASEDAGESAGLGELPVS